MASNHLQCYNHTFINSKQNFF